jgi:hypothetical protein
VRVSESGPTPVENQSKPKPDIAEYVEVLLAYIKKEYLVGIGELAIEAGEIDISGKSGAEFDEEFRTYLSEKVLNSEATLLFKQTVDFKSAILTEADRYYETGRHEFAVVFYITWIEHWVNNMIIGACRRHGYNVEDSEKLFVRANLSNKVGPVWNLLLGDPLAPSIIQAIKETNDMRNGFLHYKWPSIALDDDAWDTRHKKASSTARALIPQLIELEDRLIYGNRRTEIRRVIERRFESPGISKMHDE